MTRAGVVQKASDTFPTKFPTDRHDTAITRNDTLVFLVFFKRLQTPFDRDDTAMTRNDTYFRKETW